MQGGVNRVMLATDGDFNVGQTDDDDLKRIIEEKRKSGVFLSVFGFGRGNLNDHMMQTIAQNGNGTAAYIDTLAEAEKVLVQDASSTLFTIAKDVKIQVEFNPATISEYRLIGYETRALHREDFNNDRVDAGEIGSGHSVTAIYEITPKASPAKAIDDLRYGQAATSNGGIAVADEYAFVKIRYKLPEGGCVEAHHHAGDPGQRGRLLRRGGRRPALFGGGRGLQPEAARRRPDRVAQLRQDHGDCHCRAGTDPFGYRAEFLSRCALPRRSMALTGRWAVRQAGGEQSPPAFFVSGTEKVSDRSCKRYIFE